MPDRVMRVGHRVLEPGQMFGERGFELFGPHEFELRARAADDATGSLTASLARPGIGSRSNSTPSAA